MDQAVLVQIQVKTVYILHGTNMFSEGMKNSLFFSLPATGK